MGNPLGPRIPPQVVTDETGSYTVFTGKHCRGANCGVLLTSRNRHGLRLLCVEHGRERDRNRGKRFATVAEPFANVTDPRRLVMHQTFARWIADPTNREHNERLKAAMVDFELKYRFAYHDLLKPLPQIPVEEPTFSQPHHRTTRLEYISACDALGV